jgi:hypothetical protein
MSPSGQPDGSRRREYSRQAQTPALDLFPNAIRMRRTILALSVLAVSAACQSGGAPAAPAASPLNAADRIGAEVAAREGGGVVVRGQTVTMRRAVDMPPVNVPASTDSAIRAWRPFRPALGGAPVMCLPLPPGASTRNRSASFGRAGASDGSISILLDSAGAVETYFENRGTLSTPRFPRALSDAERDSIIADARGRTRFTRIMLNYATGRASAVNYGGGQPQEAIGGAVAIFEALPHMGDLKARTAAVLAICDR